MAPVCSLALPRSRRRRRPGAEQLELRALLSTLPDTLGVVQTDPAAGSTVRQSPTSITVTFNASVDPFSLGTQDFGLDAVNADGSLTPLDPALLTEVGVSDSDPNAITLTVDQSLAPGHYEIVVLGLSLLDGFDSDFNMLFWTPPGGFGTDTPIADFTVATPGITLKDATDLGSVGPTAITTAAALDLGTDPSAVALYRFTVEPGHAWQFGAELWTSRIDSALVPTLSLFDAQGQVVKTESIGSSNSPHDPSLFEILQPGTYYVGVSGVANVPGQPGGYDPAAGTPGASTAADGGTFLLGLAAVPDHSTAQVDSFQLDHADPQSDAPTGFTVAFSTPIDLHTLPSDGGQGVDGVAVVGQDGVIWPVTLVAVNGDDTRLTFVFNQKLPPGQYSLHVAEQAGVADLFGRTPVAPGQPAGTLASWTVRPDTAPLGANDLGFIYPSLLFSGFSVDAALEPGQRVTFRFVMPVLPNPVCTVTAAYSGGPLRVQIARPDGSAVTIVGAADAGLNAVVTVSPGVYHITLTNLGTGPLVVESRYSGNSAEQIPSNGLGQGSALNLLFVGAPGAPPTDGGTAGSSVTTTVTTAIVTAVSAPGGMPVAVSAGAATPSVPGGLVLTLGGSLVGIVAPSYTSGATDTISAGPTALAQAAVPPAQPLAPSTGEAPWSSADGTEGDVATDDVPSGPASAPVAIESPAPTDDDRDVHAVAANEWLGRLGERLAAWFALAPDPGLEPEPLPATDTLVSPARIALQRDDLPRRETERVDRADLGLPLSIGVLSVAAVRLSKPGRRWWRRRFGASPHEAARSHSGPHRRF